MPQMSGQQFAAFLREEVAAQNKGLGKLSYEELGRSCGITGRHLRRLANDKDAKGKDANPSVLVIRLVLHTLGYQVDAPEHDVLPHLKSNGGYVEELHGPKRQRVALSLGRRRSQRSARGAAQC